MKAKKITSILVEYSVEECNALDSTQTLIAELINTMRQNKCDALSGNYYEDPITISLEELEKAHDILENIKYTTEIF